jgi:hypothetical protein
MALRGFPRGLARIDFIVSQVNRDAVYEGCARIEQLDAHLAAAGFSRADTLWSADFKLYGDALYIRRSVCATLYLSPSSPLLASSSSPPPPPRPLPFFSSSSASSSSSPLSSPLPSPSPSPPPSPPPRTETTETETKEMSRECAELETERVAHEHKRVAPTSRATFDSNAVIVIAADDKELRGRPIGSSDTDAVRVVVGLHTFVAVHDQGLLLQFAARYGREWPGLTYLFVGAAACDGVELRSDTIVVHRLAGNIEAQHDLLAFTAWWTVAPTVARDVVNFVDAIALVVTSSVGAVTITIIFISNDLVATRTPSEKFFTNDSALATVHSRLSNDSALGAITRPRLCAKKKNETACCENERTNARADQRWRWRRRANKDAIRPTVASGAA